ncbi:MAG: response regulator [Sedimentitalea sp.]|nr:response regulator [Sedimentitalea sp.]
MSSRDPFEILVVEDEWMLAYDLAEQIGEAGYAVVGPAPSVGKALDLIASQRVDAGLLDLNLGGETSYPVADALSKKGIPFAFLTGYTARELRSGFRDCLLLSKPVSTGKLAALLQDLTARLSARRGDG